MTTSLGWWPSIQMVLLRNSPGGVDIDRCHCNNIQSWWVSHPTLESVTYLFTWITAPCSAEESHHTPAQEPGRVWENWASALSWLAETVLSNVAESKSVWNFSFPCPLNVWSLHGSRSPREKPRFLALFIQALGRAAPASAYFPFLKTLCLKANT